MQLRNFVLSIAALALGFSVTWAAAAPKKKAATSTKAPAKAGARKAATKSTARRYTPSAARSRAATTYARGRTRGRSPQPVAARRRTYGQQSPTTDRYMEIQQALVTRGYLNTPPTGAWDPATVDALKRFQEEQNLPPTGKITSLSLIALGLGPKRTPLATTTTLNQPVP